MDHDYSLPVPAPPVTETAPVKRKRSGEPNDRRRPCHQRSKTRINIGESLPRWRELRTRLGLQRDADLARVLLDSFTNMTSTMSLSDDDDFQNTKFVWNNPDEDDIWETASEDSTTEDYIPSISLRKGGGKKNLEQKNDVQEKVQRCTAVNKLLPPPEGPVSTPPVSHQVKCENCTNGQLAPLAYESSMRQLVTLLQIPVVNFNVTNNVNK
ncbi:uncharacterized protein LOC111576383 [Amphiprion ocellaris]|uniref:uncharacterized protein LOC111576383 n=1 Tax=Amphiprion ocellaris TaxID=80972 RepID=UPI002410BDB4|nr:uncharacterized protein LOC111576383 [Amphiprion ocellaris]XP_023137802.2 uncharacterized protein LOC111576383 [Amphiprion ocellaris]